jgi:isoleucyl-tRNA synthetase
MRWLFATVNPSQNLGFGPNVTNDIRRRFILPLWNSYAFFVTYSRIDGWTPAATATPVGERSLLDRWILSRTNELARLVRERLDDFDITTAARAIEHFVVEELSNWYIRRNRRRFWKPESDADKNAAYETLYEALVTTSKLLAPFLPFISEAMYQNLVRNSDDTQPLSVHLTDFPVADTALVDAKLSREMAAVLAVVRLGRAARSEANIKVRQPLPAILVHTPDPADADAVVRLKEQILDELNVKDVRALTELGDVLSYEVKPNLPVLGPKYGKQLGAIRGALGKANPSAIAASVNAGQAVPLSLPDGASVVLEPDEVLVAMRKREGYAAAQSSEATVVLDTELTPALVAEGIARDFVRVVQDARKQLEFNIEDTIDLRYVADDEAAAAIESHSDYVQREVLAETLTRAHDVAGAEGHAIVKVGNETVKIAISRAS